MNIALYSQCRALKLPHNEKSILLALAARASRESREAFPSVETLSKDTGMGTTNARRQLRALEDKRLIVTMGQVTGGRSNPVRYRICPEEANTCPLPFPDEKPTDSEAKANGFDHKSQHTGVAEGIEGEKRGKDAPLPADSNNDGEALPNGCWKDYIEIFGKTEWFVFSKKNRDHLRVLIPHLEQMVGGNPSAVRELFQIAMEEMSQDGWINGKDGEEKHDFPAIVFNRDRVKEFLDKADGVTVG